MVKNRSVQVRLTKNQYERIWNNCGARGFATLSDYIRYVTLVQDLATQQKIHEIHDLLIGSTERKKKRN